MNCREVDDRLNDYIDGSLPNEERLEVEVHLESCSTCRAELKGLTGLLVDVRTLPKSIDLERDLWPSISAEIDRREVSTAKWRSGVSQVRESGERMYGDRASVFGVSHYVRYIAWSLRVAAALAVAVGGFWLTVRSSASSWEVARLEGAPRVGSARLSESGRLKVGEWIETDGSSRAMINVGKIGYVEVEPNTRIRLLKARSSEHRLALAQGSMRAIISAPPRLFFVETPSAVAVDLGCVYTLTVDDAGNGLLHVTSGWVEFQRDGRRSLVPARALCETRAGVGPGTPYSQKAADRLRNALVRFDFEDGGSEALNTVLAEARETDTITLWHLLRRVETGERSAVYNRLTGFVPPPLTVTREGILKLDEKMLDLWWQELEWVWSGL